MTSELDVFRAAKLLLQEHGEDAATRAAKRADRLLEAGDTEGAAAWRRILKAVQELTRGRDEGDQVH